MQRRFAAIHPDEFHQKETMIHAGVPAWAGTGVPAWAGIPSLSVIPAKAGIYLLMGQGIGTEGWIPVCTGMTERGPTPDVGKNVVCMSFVIPAKAGI